MASGIYIPSIKNESKVCVDINSAYNLTSLWTPIAGGVQGTFTNTLSHSVVVSITAGAGGIISPAGPSIIFAGPSTSYPVTFTFDRNFSGNILLSLSNLDNGPGGIDRLCNFSIGNPINSSASSEISGNCIQSIFSVSPIGPFNFSWSDLNELNSFTFLCNRANIVSTITATIDLVEDSIATWSKTTNPNTWVDPITNTIYTTNLPAGVFETRCTEDDEYASYSKELCYKITSPISFDIGSNPFESWDAYNGIRPRQDGIPFLPSVVPGLLFQEFDTLGKRLHSVSGGTYIVHIYNGFNLISFTTNAINFTGFPAASTYTAVGIAVHPTTDVVYVMYMDPLTRRLYLATISPNASLQFIGDCQFISPITPIIDAHDITFSASGQLLMAHGELLYQVNHTNGIINTAGALQLSGPSDTFAIRNITRYSNGDLHLSGTDGTFNNMVLIYNGESYTKVREWAANNSLTSPDSSFSIAYPINPEIRFNRLFIKNLETQDVTVDDRDIITGQSITIPSTAVIKDCNPTDTNIVSWTETLCYVHDKNVISQGIVEISNSGIILSDACDPVGGFISPAPNIYQTFTHNLSGDRLYAVGSNLLDTYDWSTINAPTLLTSVAITGLVSVTETIKSIRTRWTNGSLWVMTEVVIGINRIFRFYTIDSITAVLSFQGEAIYSAGVNNNGHFTWGVDDEIYFSRNNGLGTYRVSTLSKTTYEIQNFVLDAPFVIENINTDLPNQQLILTRSGSSTIYFYSYYGDFVSECMGTSVYRDAIHAPFGIFEVGTTSHKIKKVFLKDILSGEVSSYYHDYYTGLDVILPPLTRVIDCDAISNANSINNSSSVNPRFIIITGIGSWQKSVNAPNAKSVTVSRISGTITINDSINGAQNVNFGPASFTWSGDALGNDIIVNGIAAGSRFSVNWVE